MRFRTHIRKPLTRRARFIGRVLAMTMAAAPVLALAGPAQPASADTVCGYVTVTADGSTATVPLVTSCFTCPFLSQGPNEVGAAGVDVTDYQCLT